jgi:hypothetical protein
LCLCAGLGVGPTASPARASQIASDIKLDSDDLSQPIVLDQNGRLIHLPTPQHPSPVVLASGSVPTYIGYQVDSDDTMPSGLPVVQGDPAKVAQTVGPLHLDPLDISQLDQALAKSGKALVHTTDNSNILINPIASVFGPDGSTSTTSGLASLAARAAAASTTASNPKSTPRSASTTVQTSPVTPPQAQVLIPSSTSPITNNNAIKDLQRLLEFKSGKLVNWNQHTLDALKRDLSIGSPRNVAPHAQTSSPKTAAEELAPPVLGTSGTGTPQPAPIPEPGTLAVFGVIAGILLFRQRLAQRITSA